MSYRAKSTGLMMFLLILSSLRAYGDLASYVAKPDPSFQYTLQSKAPFGPCTAHYIQLTSQTWQGIPWTHWLTIIEPKVKQHRDKSLLFITGGSVPSQPPTADTDELKAIAAIAQQTGSVCAVLQQVPNQPLFNGLNEDGIIALTFDRYLKGEGDDWPLLLPMVKSAVNAMTAIQEYGRQTFQQDIQQFVVTGASKRGWTTWLTAAADPRVAGIAPMVIDTLNMSAQSRHQLMTYGAYSDQIKDYTDLKIQERSNTPEGERLRSIVDPYAYRDALTLPKLLVFGTNDAYWCVDSANLYYPELSGPKYMYYDPNAGHDLSLRVVAPITAFYDSILRNEPLPDLRWEQKENGELTVTWSQPNARARLWKATSPNRDFRASKWTSQDLTGSGSVVVKETAPDDGWLAYYVEVVTRPAKGLPYGLSTQMTVLPDAFPHQAIQQSALR